MAGDGPHTYDVLLWWRWLPSYATLDTALLAGNGLLFVLMSSLNWWFFTRPLKKLVDSAG